MRYLLLLATFLSLFTSSLFAQCPADDFSFADGIQAPRFGNAPVSWRDQPGSSTSAFLPSDGIDVGEYGLITEVSATMSLTIVSGNTTLSLRPEGGPSVIDGPSGSLSIFGTTLSASGEYEVYLEPSNCGILPNTNSNNNNQLSITCNSCPLLPQDPANGSIDFSYDSLAPNSLPDVPFSNLGGAGVGPGLNATSLEKTAWKNQNNPLGNQRFLSTVYRSNLVRVNPERNETQLFLDVKNIEYNTDYYELIGLAEGWGASLVARNVNTGSYSVIQSVYQKGFSPAPENQVLTLNPSLGDIDEELFITIWRVRSVTNVNGLANGDFLYPSNYALFDFNIRTPVPLPAPPPHNVCAEAKPLIYHPMATCSEVDTINTFAATSSPQSSACFSTDVWLSFTATSTQYQFMAERTGDAEPYAALYAGDCNSLSLEQCYFSQSSRDTFTFIDLEVGTDYFLRLNGSFITTGVENNSFVPDPNDNSYRYCLFGTPETCTTPQAEVGEATCLDFQQYEFELIVSDLGNQSSLDVVQQNTGESLATITAPGTYLLGPVIGNNPIRLEGSNANCYGEEIVVNQFCGGEANDECSGAFNVPLSSPTAPIVRRAWGRNATPSSPALPADCGANAGARDFWFSVVNTTGDVADLVIVAAEIDDFWAEHTSYFYGGSCVDPSYLTCNAGDFNLFTDVAAGDTIFVRSVKTAINNNNVLSGTSVYAYALTPPANDDCTGAEAVAVSPNLECTTSFSGDNSQTSDGTLWYTFQPASTSVSLLISSLSATIGEANAVDFALYSGDCGSLSLITGGPLGVGFPRQFDGLTAGTDYFLSIQTTPATGRGQFEACLLTPPAAALNDDPDDAITVPVNTDGSCTLSTPGTTFGATAFFFSCAGGSRDDDVFFKFTATATAYQVDLNNVSLLQGTDPEAVIQVGRFDQFGGFSTAVCSRGTSVIASGLDVGEEYYISVYTVGSNTAIDFDLCVKQLPTPANDLCSNALPLTPNTDQTCTIQASGTLAGADGEGFTGFFCGNSTPVDDVWFTFTATAGVPYLLQVSDPGFAQRMQVYVGSCGNLTSIYCDNNQSFTVPPAVTDREIYVRVFTFEFTNDKSFDLCLQQISGSAPDNEDCEQATMIPVSTPDNCSPVAGSTFLADKDFPACFGGNAEADVYYSFVATETAHQVIVQDVVDVLGLGFATLGVEVYSGDCNNLVSIACSQPFEGGASAVVSGLTPGSSYLFRVFEHSGTAAADFNVCVQTIIPPANDEEAGAIPLTQELIFRPTNFTLEFATSSGPAVSCNGNTGTANDDVWFTFVATTTDPTIEFFNNFFEALGVEVYAPGATIPLACNDPFNNFTNMLSLTGLTVGDTYRIRVYSYNSSSLTGEAAGGEIGVYGLPTPVVYETADDFCTPLNPVSSTGSGQWIYLQAAGDLVAAVLDAEPMGQISTGVYGNAGAVRTDANGIPFLDRNLQIGVTQQPAAGNVQVALFFTQEEINQLSQATNSVISLFNLRVTKFAANDCGADLPAGAGELVTPLYSSFIGNNGGMMVVVEVDGFSSFYLHTGEQPLSATALPVSCTDFSVTSVAGSYRFNWSTAQEEDHAAWWLESSTDGISWSTLSVISGNPDRAEGGDYTYYHSEAYYGATTYFRLLAEAYDGTFEQACGVQQLSRDIARPKLVQLFPNPASSQEALRIVVELPLAAQGEMTLLDLYGRPVATKSINGTVGSNEIGWQLPKNTSTGVFQLLVSFGDHQLTRRVVIR